MTVFLPFPLVPRLGAGFSFGLSLPLTTVYPTPLDKAPALWYDEGNEYR